MFAPRSKLRRHTPPVLSSRFFGWIPQLIRIPEAELLECVGLDAVMLLRFFRMAMKLFMLCLIPALLIVLPVNIYTGSEGGKVTGPDDDDGDEDNNSDGVTDPSRQGPWSPFLYLFTQFTFTWVFSLITIYMLWRTYEGYISIRRQYLLKRHKSITNRTVMIVGLPTHLQSDRGLATFYESLGTGTVESAHVCRHVGRLKRLIQLRARALRDLELVYTQYYGNPSGRADYSPKTVQAENDRYAMGEDVITTGAAGASSLTASSSTSSNHRPDGGSSSNSSGEKVKKRPTMRLGFMGLFGKKVDKIDHYREVFATLDKAVQKLRLSRIFATTSIGFVTFEDMHAAQIVAQTVNTEETLSCRTFLAPEPRDVYWDNLNLPPSELSVRAIVINVIVFCLIFFWAGPVGVLSSFLDIDSLDKVLPGIAKIAANSPLIGSLIQGFLPTLGVIVFLAVVPRILLSLCRRQGIQVHSEIAQAIFNKYFIFILVNVVLVFTIVGTWAQTVNKVYHDVGELTLLLAVSLRRVAPFFVNYIILRGIGLLPLQLLQIADVFTHVFQGLISRTPREYAEARAPPELPYGVLYANATLAFVIILIYSTIRPFILVFGIIYFAMAWLVYKYQLLYVFFHPYESGGQMFPMVYDRLTFGLLLFQLTMVGLFMLKQAYFFGIFLSPLLAGTVWFWYWTTNAYKMTAKYVPLELLRPKDEDAEEYLEISYSHGRNPFLDPDNDHNNNNDGPVRQHKDVTDPKNLAALGSDLGSMHGLGGTMKPVNGKDSIRWDKPFGFGDHITVDLRKGLVKDLLGDDVEVEDDRGKGVKAAAGKRPRRWKRKSVVDEDDYQAIPDRCTDYRQPPMTLYPGVLNSRMHHYNHPAFSGPLPTLWLPLKKSRRARRTEDGQCCSSSSSSSSSGSSTSDDEDDGEIRDEEARIGHGHQHRRHRRHNHAIDQALARPPLSLPSQSADEPQTFDEGDNLAGGGQDEEDIDSGDILGQQEEIGGRDSDRDRSNDVVDGLSSMGSPSQAQQQGHSDDEPTVVKRPGSVRRNPAVEGITEVYYHHPERRPSNASTTTRRLWRRSRGSGEDAEQRPMPAQKLRASVQRHLRQFLHRKKDDRED
ncbi:hypothetical protein BGZ94_006369 [Podila epigama]|nr:hypothetical protein BGZ94_006369 [Podila epigama]